MRISRWVFGAAVVAAAPAWAEPLAVQPGLWEGTVEAEGGGASAALQQLLQNQIARLKPDQQAKLQAVIAAAGGAALTERMCVTPSLLQRALTGSGGPGHCSRSVLSSTAKTLDLQVSCTSGARHGTGTLRLTAADAKSVAGSVDGQLTIKDGTTIPFHRAVQARWLAADCGGVRAPE